MLLQQATEPAPPLVRGILLYSQLRNYAQPISYAEKRDGIARKFGLRIFGSLTLMV
jgi:hypothetical protein